ncbi:glycosyl transferase family 4 [Natroniella acetigena]|uniref:glycosyl transferase family 4 n=1 Tax=Natroniella acetigena TaxID=52004 RepID=UPI00200A12BB|nr:glycosyl transferase family 4 [Natroniella acetigena]MCK8826610.1 glycosyl transferase family 4 [Natroniella acetigena]
MLWLITLAIALTYINYPIVKNILIKYQLVATNYAGKQIPLGYGILLVVNLIILLSVGINLRVYSTQVAGALLYLVIVAGGLGLIDDYYGEQDQSSGLSGHVGEFISNSRVTTGLLKAVFISLIVFLLVTEVVDSLVGIIINFLLVVLMTNFINLLDLRPGRALKGFIIVSAPLLLITTSLFDRLIIPLLIMIMMMLPVDLKAEAMLGDVGANLLGSFLGFSLVFSIAESYKVIFVLLLIGVHLYTEKFSLTELIAQNEILNKLDQFGRDKD